MTKVRRASNFLDVFYCFFSENPYCTTLNPIAHTAAANPNFATYNPNNPNTYIHTYMLSFWLKEGAQINMSYQLSQLTLPSIVIFPNYS